jgi:hypothetical protein
MNRKQASARAALNTYAATVDGAEKREPRDTQAADLITDLLLMFEADTAHQIIAKVERNLAEEQEGATPVYVGV